MDKGYLRITSDQKLLIEKDQDEDTPGRGSRPEYSISGRTTWSTWATS